MGNERHKPFDDFSIQMEYISPEDCTIYMLEVGKWFTSLEKRIYNLPKVDVADIFNFTGKSSSTTVRLFPLDISDVLIKYVGPIPSKDMHTTPPPIDLLQFS